MAPAIISRRSGTLMPICRSLIGLPISVGMTLKSCSAGGVTRRRRRSRSSITIGILVFFKKLSTSLFATLSSIIRFCNSSFRVVSSSFVDCNSSRAVSISSFVDCSSSLLERISSLAERNSSLVDSCSSTTDCRYFFVFSNSLVRRLISRSRGATLDLGVSFSALSGSGGHADGSRKRTRK